MLHCNFEVTASPKETGVGLRWKRDNVGALEVIFGYKKSRHITNVRTKNLSFSSLCRQIQQKQQRFIAAAVFVDLPKSHHFSILTPLNLPPLVLTSMNCPFSALRLTNNPVFGLSTCDLPRTAPIRCPSP